MDPDGRLMSELRCNDTRFRGGAESQHTALSKTQSGRALLQQTQAFPSRRNPIRQTGRQLSRIRRTRLNTNLDAL